MEVGGQDQDGDKANEAGMTSVRRIHVLINILQLVRPGFLSRLYFVL